MHFNTIEEALTDVQEGKMIIIVDDVHRENEGDLVIAAEKATSEHLGFMIRHSSGIICVPLTKERIAQLEIPLMVSKNTEMHKTAFTVSVDSKNGTSTGISAADRVKTIQALVDDTTKPDNLARPGHIFPLQYTEGGIFTRQGHTEASIDIMKLAGLKPGAAICEIMNDDGSVTKQQDLFAFAQKHDLKIISINELVQYRLAHETIVTQGPTVKLPTEYGTFTATIFSEGAKDHVALMKGDMSKQPVLVRVHSECFTGDILGSLRCDCGSQLAMALERINKEGGILLYLRQEGRGIGLVNKFKAYQLQDRGLDTVDANVQLGFEADQRSYHVAAHILKELGVTKIKLLTNNPKKRHDLCRYGIAIVSREQIESTPSEANKLYLSTKKERMGHFLTKT